jgi:glycosyltransferase involved in cell wall biosynthesis
METPEVETNELQLDLTAIILTLNEEIHIRRCIQSVGQVAQNIIVVDSGSSDNTVSIARELGAQVFIREFINHADQLRWAMSLPEVTTKWVIRVDADEYLSAELVRELPALISDPECFGVVVQLDRVFLGRDLHFGGVRDLSLLRVWRNGHGRVVSKWMDEYLVVDGKIRKTNAAIVDANLNSIAWWSSKHVRYAIREAIDILISKERNARIVDNLEENTATSRKIIRLLKERVYLKLPPLIRSFMYLAYRLFFRLGILDGVEGIVYHVLQGFWYRFLVDAMVREVNFTASRTNQSWRSAVFALYGVRVG